MIEPALASVQLASHAYLFHGPGGSGKRSTARRLAGELLALGSDDPDGARARVASGSHPDLTWVVPSGAHEILVSDIDGPVVAAATKTPFEAERRVFVIERIDELGEEAANRMLKTLEEPPSFVHLILVTNHVGEVLPTIVSRCQLVRFQPPSEVEVAVELESEGVASETALACALLSLGDGERARELATPQGASLRAAAEEFAGAAITGTVARRRPWLELLSAVRAKGESVRDELESRAVSEVMMYPRKEHKRVETEWGERIRRSRRRVETEALDGALELVALWLIDLSCLAWEAPDLVRHRDRLAQLRKQAGIEPSSLRRSVELVEETRTRFQLNVSEELACEALAYRLERTLHQ